MRKLILMIKAFLSALAILLATGINTSLAATESSNDVPNSGTHQFGSNIAAQCQQTVATLAQVKSFAQLPTFAQTISEFEQVLLPAHNLLFESYLYGNVSPNETIRLSAERCQLKLSAQIDLTLASQATAKLLNYTYPLVKSKLEKRVQSKYQQQHNELANSEFLALKKQAKQHTNQFRKTATVSLNGSFKLSEQCTASLPKKYHKRFVVDGHIEAELIGKNYATLIKRITDEECRKQVYVQYQGRHKRLNQNNLLTMITGQNKKAQALGFANFAEYSLQNTSFSSVQQVNSFLANLAQAQTDSAAPWNVAFEKNQTKVKSSTKNAKSAGKASLIPSIAQQGLFTLLNDEFDLQVKKINDPVWHPSVAVYQLSQGNQLVGKFYLDLYSRDGKYTKNRHRAIKRGVQGVQQPSSALILNLPKEQWQQKHIKSFFHEFGHLLHNLLAIQEYHIISGISLEKDLIEMPAKWFEWLSFSEKMQKKMFNQVLFKGDKPNTGSQFKMRLYRSALALTYFNDTVTANDIDLISARLSLQYLRVPYLQGADSQYSFSHLGTYGPRYYSYIWSEKVAQKLLDDYLNNRFSGQDFTVALFSQGGSIDMTQMLSLLYKKPISQADIMQWVNNEKQL